MADTQVLQPCNVLVLSTVVGVVLYRLFFEGFRRRRKLRDKVYRHIIYEERLVSGNYECVWLEVNDRRSKGCCRWR